MTYDRLVMIDDIGRTFTANCAAAISGGFLVGWVSGTDSVGSNISTYAWGDIVVDASPSTTDCLGIALQAQASGTYLEIPIATEGIFVLPAGSDGVTAGAPVECAGYENMVNSFANTASGTKIKIGRALTSATALTGFAIIKLDI